MIGEVVGKYKIIRELGSGGMGTVYKAYQISLNRYVAIKILPAHLAKDKEFVERFHREAKAAARINHPRVVQIYDIDEHKGMYYFAMEFVKGKPLTKAIKERWQLSCEQALNIAFQVAEALECAHKEGIIHRDIKPGNIMVDESGQVKVTDFGIAKAMEVKGLTVTGTVLGTPEYMSPEQAKGEMIDGRSDIYSLGVVLYEMLTGEVPFDAETPYAIIQQHVNVEPKPVTKINPILPREVEFIVERCLMKDVSLRYQTATELLKDIRDYRAGVLYPGTIKVPSKLLRPAARKTKVLGLISLLVAAVAMGGFLLGKRFLKPTPSAPKEAVEELGQIKEEEIQELFSRAEALVSEKKYSQAITYYQEIIDTDPVSRPADSAREKIEYVKGKIEEESVETLFNQAGDLENKGEMVKAISSYQEIAARYPESKWAKLAEESIRRIEELEKSRKEAKVEEEPRLGPPQRRYERPPDRFEEEPLSGPEKKIMVEVEKLMEKDLKIMGLSMKGDHGRLEKYLLENHYENMKRIGKMLGLEPGEFSDICAGMMIDEFGPPPPRYEGPPDRFEEEPMPAGERKIMAELEKLTEEDMKLMGLSMKGDHGRLEKYLLENHYEDMKRIGKMLGLEPGEFSDICAGMMIDEFGPPPDRHEGPGDRFEEGRMPREERKIREEVDKLMEKDTKIMGLAMKGDREKLKRYLLKNHYEDMKRIGKMLGLEAGEFAGSLARKMTMGPPDRQDSPSPDKWEDYR